MKKAFSVAARRALCEQLHQTCKQQVVHPMFVFHLQKSVLSDEGGWADFYPTTSDLPISLAHPELPEGNVENPTKGVKHKSSKQCLFLSQLSGAFFPHCSLPPPSPPPSPIALQFILFLQKHTSYWVQAYVELQWAATLCDRPSLCLLHPACFPVLLQHRWGSTASPPCYEMSGVHLGTVRNKEFQTLHSCKTSLYFTSF